MKATVASLGAAKKPLTRTGVAGRLSAKAHASQRSGQATVGAPVSRSGTASRSKRALAGRDLLRGLCSAPPEVVSLECILPPDSVQ
eukprot:scaffold3256_cov444-Prasinococcus_capsulatus_cf.AAC.3